MSKEHCETGNFWYGWLDKFPDVTNRDKQRTIHLWHMPISTIEFSMKSELTLKLVPLTWHVALCWDNVQVFNTPSKENSD